MNRLGVSAAVLCVATIAAACSSAPTPTVSPSPTAPTPAATVASTATRPPASAPGPATPTPEPTIPGLREGLHDAGTYRTLSGFLLTLPQGWSLYFDEPGGTYLSLGKGEFLVSGSGQVVDPETHHAAPRPEDLMAWFVAHPELRVTEPTSVDISGHQASYVEINPTRRIDVFYDPLGNFHVGPGRVARFYVIPRDGPDIFIAVLKDEFGTIEGTLELAIPVAEGVQIVE